MKKSKTLDKTLKKTIKGYLIKIFPGGIQILTFTFTDGSSIEIKTDKDGSELFIDWNK